MAVEPFATYADVTARYDLAAPEERVRARLADATLYLLSLLPRDYERGEDGTYDAMLSTVCAEMVGNALSGPEGLDGVTGYSLGANGYSESYTLANSTGSLYLTRRQTEMLGLGGQEAWSIRPAIGEEP